MTNCFCAPTLLCNSVYEHQNNSLVSAATVRHSSTYIILYILMKQSEPLTHHASCATLGVKEAKIISKWTQAED